MTIETKSRSSENSPYKPDGKNFYRHLERESGARPVIIVPPLGNTGLIIEYLAQKLGLSTIASLKRDVARANNPDKVFSPKDYIPALVTTETKEKGTKLSSEYICYPFKVMLGSMLDGLGEFKELIAKTGGKIYPLILTHKSSGTCRERQYAEVQQRILGDLRDNDFDFYTLHESASGVRSLTSFLAKLSHNNRLNAELFVYGAINRLEMIDRFEDKVRYRQSLLANIDAVNPILEKARSEITRKDIGNKQLKKNMSAYLQEIDKLDKVREKPLGVFAVTGEIFHCEEFMNNSSNFIGREFLKRGYYFEKRVGLHEYTSRFKLDKVLLNYLKHLANPGKKSIAERLAKKAGLNHDVGGHGVDVVALFQEQLERKTYDGIIEIGPFGCTPLVAVSGNVRKIKENSMKKGHSLPHLVIQVDQQDASAGQITRIEAFLDMTARSKQKKRRQYEDYQRKLKEKLAGSRPEDRNRIIRECYLEALPGYAVARTGVLFDRGKIKNQQGRKIWSDAPFYFDQLPEEINKALDGELQKNLDIYPWIDVASAASGEM